MLTTNQCVLCILNQMLRVCDFCKLDEETKNAVFKEALKTVSDHPFHGTTAPEFAALVYDTFVQVTGIADPYKKLRGRQNRMVMERIDFFKKRIAAAADPLRSAVLYSLLGNVIDYGSAHLFDPEDVFKEIDDLELELDDYTELKNRLPDTDKLLIIGDNAGEGVLDKLLIGEMLAVKPDLQVFYGVRSQPAINDMLIEDARSVGLDRVARVLETGSNFAGTVISRSTDEFKRLYEEADLVISKGQGNFETLIREPRDILFILKLKCPQVARFVDRPLGALVLAFKSSFPGL